MERRSDKGSWEFGGGIYEGGLYSWIGLYVYG